MMNKLRKILFPFSVLYHGVTSLRNWLYEKDYLKSVSFEKPVICVGNLSVGGTGKSPMIEFLISLLRDDHKIAVLSRGYKRKTKGFQLVDIHSSAEEVGDEPLQFKRKFPDVIVAVDANRKQGIAKLENEVDVILLDDAFQHRSVKPSFSILLTTYADIYIHDYVLPAGNLRESRVGADRADVIIVTKCPEKIPYAEQQEIQYKLKLKPHQRVYFSTISYASIIQGKEDIKHLDYLTDKKFTLVTGIANPKPLEGYLKECGFGFDHISFSDHHHFTNSEIQMLDEKELILTTEKDFMRLKDRLKNVSVYYMPIHTTILNKEEGLKRRIINAANSVVTEETEEI